MHVSANRLLQLSLAGLLSACGGDPNLTLTSGDFVLVVGQRASVEVVEGGDGAELDDKSLTLTDADGQLFEATSSDFEVSRPKAREVQFVVPPGIAQGEASLEVRTIEGPSFKGEVAINRLVTLRDRAGKIWVLTLTGGDQAAQFAEIPAGDMGPGRGMLAIGEKGRLLASTSSHVQHVQLARLGGTPEVTPGLVIQDATVIQGLAVTATGKTLVATDKGTHILKRPSDPSAPLEVETVLDTKNTVAVAADLQGKGAVTLSVDATGRALVRPVNLAQDPPRVLFTIELPWSASGAELMMAISPDAKVIMVVDGTNDKVAMIAEGSTTAEAQSFPAGEEGAVAVASSGDGSVFFVGNKVSHNVSVINVSGSTFSFGEAVSLPGAASDPSGGLVDLKASTNDDVLVLLERDLLLLDPSSSLTPLTFSHLFTDKQSGEVGSSLAIQP